MVNGVVRQVGSQLPTRLPSLLETAVLTSRGGAKVERLTMLAMLPMLPMHLPRHWRLPLSGNLPMQAGNHLYVH